MAQLLEALEALHRRASSQLSRKQASHALQSVVLDYVTARLITQVNTELYAQWQHANQRGVSP
jgi:hypothetical protein